MENYNHEKIQELFDKICDKNKIDKSNFAFGVFGEKHSIGLKASALLVGSPKTIIRGLTTALIKNKEMRLVVEVSLLLAKKNENNTDDILEIENIDKSKHNPDFDNASDILKKLFDEN